MKIWHLECIQQKTHTQKVWIIHISKSDGDYILLTHDSVKDRQALIIRSETSSFRFWPKRDKNRCRCMETHECNVHNSLFWADMNEKPPKYPSAGEWLNNPKYTHTLGTIQPWRATRYWHMLCSTYVLRDTHPLQCYLWKAINSK